MRKDSKTYISLPAFVVVVVMVAVFVGVFTHLAHRDYKHKQDSELKLSGVYGVNEGVQK